MFVHSRGLAESYFRAAEALPHALSYHASWQAPDKSPAQLDREACKRLTHGVSALSMTLCTKKAHEGAFFVLTVKLLRIGN